MNGYKNGKDYRTFMSERIQLRGWKRYAVQKDWTEGEQVIPQRHDFTNATSPPPTFKAATAFKALKKGATFKGKLRFHNLKPEELGALAWAIEWDGDVKLRHLVGMGKGLGLESVRMTILNQNVLFEKADGSDKVSLQAARKAFVDTMKFFVQTHSFDWENSDTINELKLLADPEALNKGQVKKLLRYPKLEVGGPNEFTEARNRHNRLVLRSYGEATGRRSRAAWDPNVAPTPATSAPASSPECEVTIVKKRNKRQAMESGSQTSFQISNLSSFPDATEGTRWRATKTGTGASPVYILISFIPDDQS